MTCPASSAPVMLPTLIAMPAGEDSALGDFLEDKRTVLPTDILLNQDLATQMKRALSGLSDKQREILRLRFGIGTEREQTLEEIGRGFSVTRERIRQIETKALRQLRRPLHRQILSIFAEHTLLSPTVQEDSQLVRYAIRPGLNQS